jgi:predicted SPOUT superfamily RNA methylase MTH1
LAAKFSDVFAECPYEGGYDMTVGTSERGQNVYSDDFKFPEFKHLLIVFGGLNGIEEGIVGDETVREIRPEAFFKLYLNTVPNQGSRTIRTEEAIPVTLAALQKHISYPDA